MIEVWGVTDRGKVRSQNQDTCAYATLEGDCAYGLVCDGMGGARAGDIASQTAVTIFQKHLQHHDFAAESDENLLRRVVGEANREIYFQSEMVPAYAGMGTTLVAAVLRADRATIANVGDSRAYLRTHQGLTQITRDHSLVEDLVRQGTLTPAQARRHPQKNLITRALGTGASVEVDLFTCPLAPGDLLLLCSDGLINEVTDEELSHATQEGALAEMGGRLLELALRRGAPDNVTIVLLRRHPSQEEGD